MSKHQGLSDKDISNRPINSRLEKLIAQYQEKTGITKSNLRILDYGHGRGITVAKLRGLGFQAYGVEIDPTPYNNGLPWFEQNGYEPKDFLHMIKDDCITPFPNVFFDIVFSEQVLEHVADMEIVARELSRVTKKGGEHLHVFPPKWHVTEVHLFMPFIHWLPKNNWRKKLIRFFVSIGAEPFWEQLNGKSIVQKTQIYYEYSIAKTFYRSGSELKGYFQKYGFFSKYNLKRGAKTLKNIFGLFPTAACLYAERK